MLVFRTTTKMQNILQLLRSELLFGLQLEVNIQQMDITNTLHNTELMNTVST
ncbi:hypothetical protein D3C73_651160 [compost metagenome]